VTHTALIALGANLGDRQSQLERGLERLGREPGVRVLRRSAWYETSPVGGPTGQQPFLNGAALLETSLTPQDLLAAMFRVEQSLGRTRDERWAARTLDLDLLLFDDWTLQTKLLRLPHPRMAYRRFVLEPAAEVAPEMIHPTIGWTLARLLTHLNSALPYVAIAGPPGSGKSHLAQALLAGSLGWLIAEPTPEPADLGTRLDRWAKTLDTEHWPQVRATAVSDFWFDQLLVSAALESSPDEWESFHSRWQAARARVATPKLTLVLDAPAAQLAERWQAQTHLTTSAEPLDHDALEEWLERQRAALVAYAVGPGLGPVLTLDAGEETVMLAEAQAAIEAMQ